MYVCICHAVTEHQVRDAIQAGAETVADVTRACRAGGDCGSCRQQVEEMIEDHADACAGRRLAVVRPAHRAA